MNLPDNSDPDRPDPLAARGVVRIALSERASHALTETGKACFAIVGRGSYPTDPARMVVYLLPVPLRIAQDACKVALGTHAARRIKTPSRANVAQPSPHRQPDPQATGTPPARNLFEGPTPGRDVPTGSQIL